MRVVLLCAGKWTRILPFTKILPKEMLPIGDKPLLHHSLDNFRKNEINDFLFVLSENKTLIREYFSYSDNIYNNKWISELNELINESKIDFVNDKYKWTGWSLLCAKDEIDENYFMLVFGDMYISSENIQNMLKIHNDTGSMVILINKVDKSYRANYKETIIWDDAKIKSLLVDPDKESLDDMDMVWWIFILHRDIFVEIAGRIDLEDIEKEVGVVRPIENMLKHHDIYAYKTEWWIYDIWNIDERKKAFINF